MTTDDLRRRLDGLLNASRGIVRLKPAWVARDFLPPGRRLGLPEEAYDVGERGFICERWLASTTQADNRVGPPDEGLSFLSTEGGPPLTLHDAVTADSASIMGAEYARAHPGGLGRLAKIFDYGARLPYHIHPTQEYASLVGRKSKDEAYYFLPGTELGAHPESFFGVHPWISRQSAHDVLLPYLVDWDSDLILRHARAELQVPDEGFLIPSGVLHAPGTALTLELQEDSDVLAMFQALNAGRIISKDLLFKDVRPVDRSRDGERFPLGFVEWDLNGDPYFYENHHLSPQPVPETPGGTQRVPADGPQPAASTSGGQESWIFYNTVKFSGKKLVVSPGAEVTTTEPGVYNILVWTGHGSYGGQEVRGGDPDLDELLVVHYAATQPHTVRNLGNEDLVVYKFFGPDIQPAVPMTDDWR